jgi:hypothetical protein
MTGDSLVDRHGSAKHPGRPAEHQRPAGVSDQTVIALGKLSEALEIVEHARGLLYGFHRLCGSADLTLQDAVQQLREAGHGDLADEVEEALVGRDIVEDKWSFQLIEAYDAQYWRVFRDVEHSVRSRAGVREPHLFEAELKHREQTPGAEPV